MSDPSGYECLSPRSKEYADKTQKCLELHMSDRKVAAQKTFLKMQTTEEKIPTGYRIIRLLFHACVDVFYHYTEVVGAENIPPTGNAAILCPNHGNSLTDAVVCVSQTPRMVRLTAKDTLFKVPLFGYIVRNVGTVPLQRKDEHQEGVDNKQAVTQLNQELLNGSLVCLFPEGRSRFHWKVDGIQRGVSSIAYTCLVQAKEQGNMDYTISLCPSAFNYLHREKFRSGLVVEYGPPLILTPKDDIMQLERADAIAKISEQIQELMSLTAFSAEDWNTLRIAHTARNIFAPLGTRMTIVEFVRLTKYWGNALSVNDKSDPTLREDLTAYQERLETIGLKDNRVSRPRGSSLYIMWCMLLRVFQICVMLVPALVGALLWAPAFYATKHQEKVVMKRTKKPTHVDEVAQYKMMYGLMILPVTMMVTCLVTVLVQGWPWWDLLWLVPCVSMFMWFSIRIIEDGIAALRSLKSLKTLLLIDNKELEEARKMREDLVPRVAKRAALCGDLKPPAIRAEKRGFWFEFISKFDPKRRRKKDWNEVLRLHEVLPVDYAAIQRERSASLGESQHTKKE
eukprot:TRINITY_DN3430_c0_g2_i4.p1 TRINITY_DN3430_c0_g2~~TRINITY_DN3430_c0_g2_i4.p1  ORF type:complete len:567 (+),score=208.05 TRINITY_DN3430_c0_g2_i4:115-1815(+)